MTPLAGERAPGVAFIYRLPRALSPRSHVTGCRVFFPLLSEIRNVRAKELTQLSNVTRLVTSRPGVGGKNLLRMDWLALQ